MRVYEQFLRGGGPPASLGGNLKTLSGLTSNLSSGISSGLSSYLSSGISSGPSSYLSSGISSGLSSDLS